MKKTILFLALALAMVSAKAQDAASWQRLEKKVNFIVANDLGRNGYYD